MATRENLPNLGIWVNGESFGKESPEEGHFEIASRILNNHKFWKDAFEENPKYIDPVDWLIYRKGAIKIGSAYGEHTLYYSSDCLDREGFDVIALYRTMHWKAEDQAQNRWQIERG